jgi:hypothetical protein
VCSPAAASPPPLSVWIQRPPSRRNRNATPDCARSCPGVS